MSTNHTIPDIKCLGPDTIGPDSDFKNHIPRNISYALVPAVDYSAPWMGKCCEPQPLHWINGCYVWCELPSEGGLNKNEDGEPAFATCLADEGRPGDESRALFIQAVPNGDSPPDGDSPETGGSAPAAGGRLG